MAISNIEAEKLFSVKRTTAHNEQAQQDSIRRVLQAIVREKLLPYTWMDSSLIISVNNTEQQILIDNAAKMSLERIIIHGQCYVLEDHRSRAQLISSPQQLLKILDPAFVHFKQWQQFKEEVLNSRDNTLLMLKNKVTQLNTLDTTLHHEQLASQGHPFHPCNKTKLGFNANEVIAYSPEFANTVALVVAAIHIEHAHLELSSPIEYQKWFAIQYPEQYQAWLQQLLLVHVNPNDYLPVPIHPWQNRHVIHKTFKDLIINKQLIIFETITINTKPTLSFRTMVSGADKAHIKLPVAVQATSAIRTVSPASAENGPKISKLLKKIVDNDTDINKHLYLAGEFIGLHVTGFDDAIAKNLSVLYRDNPNTLVASDESTMVVAALFNKQGKQPLLIKLLAQQNIKTKKSALSFFTDYVELLLSCFLDLYLRYGIALEAHQQNTLLVLKNNNIVKMMIRDFGGVRIHTPCLKQHATTLTPYPGSATFTEDLTEVRNKLIHTLYQTHIAEVILLLSQHFLLNEALFWAIVREKTEQHINKHARMCPDFDAESELNAFLREDWILKSLLHMRLADTYSSYIYAKVTNPLISVNLVSDEHVV